MDLNNINQLEKATSSAKTELMRISIALLFMFAVMIYVLEMSGGVDRQFLLVAAAVIGGYMALNIGANDVANNVGPAVGSKALTMGGAILIAAIFESMGAIVAGGDVVSTIKKGIIDPAMIADSNTFIWLMMA
ncbi:MAG: inorganic phosphate transporter, partial [Methylococcales bacterium]|nr:inorganic phosphate transporter [Methylococcales bacterium]